MNDSPNSQTGNILTQKELRRYEQQINIPFIGKQGQEKIKQSKVLVIGTGSKGTTILQYLSSLGVGKLGICDNSSIQENELSRQFLFGNNDLGKQKAIATKQKLHDINNLIHYEVHNVFLNEYNMNSISEDYDILVDTTEDFKTHYLINDTAIKIDKPFVLGFIKGHNANVSVFNYKGGPSLKCLFPVLPDNEFSDAYSDFFCQISLIGIVGAIMANEVIKIILGLNTSLSGSLMTFHSNEYKITFDQIIKNPSNFVF